MEKYSQVYLHVGRGGVKGRGEEERRFHLHYALSCFGASVCAALPSSSLFALSFLPLFYSFHSFLLNLSLSLSSLSLLL